MLVQLGAKQTTLLEIAGTVLGPTEFSSVGKAVKAVADAVVFALTRPRHANIDVMRLSHSGLA